MRFRLALLILLPMALLAGAFTALWFLVAGQAEATVNSRFATWRAAGIAISHGTVSRSGFPLNMRLTWSDPVFAGSGEGATRWRARTQALSMEVRPWNWNGARFRTIGPLHLDLVNGAGQDITARANRAQMLLWQDGATDGDALSLRLDEVVIGRKPAFTLGQLQLQIMLPAVPVAVPAAVSEQPWADIALRLIDPRHPILASLSGNGDAMGTQIDLDMRIHGIAHGAAGSPRDRIVAWRDAGGRVDIRRLALVRGPAVIETSGSLSLDEFFRPRGAFDLQTSQIRAALDGLADAGLADRGMASMIGGAAELLAGLSVNGDANNTTGKEKDDGQGQAISITLAEGALFLGPFELLALPALLPPINADGAVARPAPAVQRLHDPPDLSDMPELTDPPTAESVPLSGD